MFAATGPRLSIKIATLNGAVYLGREKQIGSIATGKNADLADTGNIDATELS